MNINVVTVFKPSERVQIKKAYQDTRKIGLMMKKVERDIRRKEYQESYRYKPKPKPLPPPSPPPPIHADTSMGVEEEEAAAAAGVSEARK